MHQVDLSAWYWRGAMASDSFDSKSTNIGNLIGVYQRERIVVPHFQRGYSWVKKHFEVFWNDIVLFQEESALDDGPKKYFLGPIVTLRKNKDDIVLLLDGQQRLATITIFLSVLRDIARELPTKGAEDFARDIQNGLIENSFYENTYSLQLGDTDEKFFRNAIQLGNLAQPKLRTHRNIAAARKFLYDKVKNNVDLSNPVLTLTYLRALKQTLTSDLVMAEIPVNSERDAFRIFETLNDRGLRLSVPDLLLNFLMGEAKSDADRKQIRESWTEMVEQMKERDITQFFRHLWVSKYGDLKKTDLFTALKEHIKSESINSVDFARACEDECDKYVHLINVDKFYLEPADSYVAKLYKELNQRAALPLLLSCFNRMPNKDFATVCRLLLVFITRFSIIAGLDNSSLENILFSLARETRQILEQTPVNVNVVIAHIKQTLITNSPTDEKIEASIKELYLEPNEASYVMRQIANYIQTNTKEFGVNEANIEHIFPKNPKEHEWGGKKNHELLEPLLWHIGNLTVLGERINRDVGNAEFHIKRDRYENRTEVEMTKQIARDYSEWNVDNIKKRAVKLTKDIMEIWKFDNPSRV